AGLHALLSELRRVPARARSDARPGPRAGRLRPARGGAMSTRAGRFLLLAFLILGIGGEATAQTAPTYRWIDEQGNPHYAGRRDQVPERYRNQLPDAKPGEPPRPKLPSSPRATGVSSKVTGECQLRVRGTEQHRASSSSYPNCEACAKALDQMRGEAKSR